MYETDQPERAEVDGWTGPVVLNFGTNWCGICQAAKPVIAAAMAANPDVRHVKIEDGKGRPLGRSFGVKLWPNLVFMRDGLVIEQLARPDAEEIAQALKTLQG